LQPNRLQAAKQIINNFLDKQKNNRVWFVVFAWKPFTSLPLNFDYNISKKILDKISVDTINQRASWLQWTAIWDGLIFAGDNFDDSNREKVIVLLTDGTANAWVNPEQAVEFLNNKYKNNKIKIYSIWIWKDEKTFINIQNIMWFSQQVEIWWVDEKPLKYIAKLSWWKYFRADNNQTLSNIFSEISELEKTDIEIDTIENIESKASYFSYTLTILLLLLFLIKTRKHIYNR
jgi:Ca-activated chloride channel family protein